MEAAVRSGEPLQKVFPVPNAKSLPTREFLPPAGLPKTIQTVQPLRHDYRFPKSFLRASAAASRDEVGAFP